MAEAFNIGVTAWSPLGGGLLTGKYNKGGNREGFRAQNRPPIKERDLNIAEEVLTIADELGKPASQVALNWLRSKNHTIPIIGARKVEQVKENLGCLGLGIERRHLKRLDEISAVELGFPQRFMNSPMVQDWAFGGGLKQIDNLNDATKAATAAAGANA